MAFDRSAIKSGVTHLQLTQNGKLVSIAISKLTDAQIAAAMKMPVNADALASGWTVQNGNVVKASSAPAGGTGAPPPASTPAPTPLPGQQAPAPGATQPAAPLLDKSGYTADVFKGSGIIYMYVDGGRKRVDKMTRAEILTALKDDKRNRAFIDNGYYYDNGHIYARPGTTNNSTQQATNVGGGGSTGGGGGGEAAPATGGGAAGGGGASTNTPTAGTQAPSWIPPMIGLNGLNADPVTGRIDWTSLLNKIGGVSAIDPQYAQDLSQNIMAAMQSISAPQAEIQSLTAVNPSTGKTLYQQMFESALKQHNQAQSSTLGQMAARGIAGSGMQNSTLAQHGVTFAGAANQAEKQYGNTRIADLLKSMTGTLAEQDNNFASSYYAALSRANQRIPGIPDVTAGG